MGGNMNGKKARAIRKYLKLDLSKPCEYKFEEHEMMRYTKNTEGKLVATPIKKYTAINTTKAKYRKIKKLITDHKGERK